MKRRLLMALALALLLIVGVACASEPETDTEAGSEASGETTVETEVDREAVELAATLAQARGHAAVAQELLEADDVEGATLHAGHPLAEILEPLGGELEEHGADVEALSGAFTALAEAVAGGDVAAMGEAVGEVDTTTTEAAEAVSEGASEDAAFDGSVISSLLSVAGHEYGEAVAEDGSIGLLEEYQDAYGFVREAQVLYEEIVNDVTEASEEEAAEIDEAFDALEQALPTVTAPEEVVDGEDVEAATALIAHELEETVGALPIEESDPEEVVAEIESLLDEIETLYADGEAEEAAELAAEAYLENYEVIEAGVIQADAGLNAELEPLLGAELRKQIQEGAPEEEISSMIDRARELLQEALAALEEAA